MKATAGDTRPNICPGVKAADGVAAAPVNVALGVGTRVEVTVSTGSAVGSDATDAVEEGVCEDIGLVGVCVQAKPTRATMENK